MTREEKLEKLIKDGSYWPAIFDHWFTNNWKSLQISEDDPPAPKLKKDYVPPTEEQLEARRIALEKAREEREAGALSEDQVRAVLNAPE